MFCTENQYLDGSSKFSKPQHGILETINRNYVVDYLFTFHVLVWSRFSHSKTCETYLFTPKISRYVWTQRLLEKVMLPVLLNVTHHRLITDTRLVPLQNISLSSLRKTKRRDSDGRYYYEYSIHISHLF